MILTVASTVKPLMMEDFPTAQLGMAGDCSPHGHPCIVVTKSADNNFVMAVPAVRAATEVSVDNRFVVSPVRETGTCRPGERRGSAEKGRRRELGGSGTVVAALASDLECDR